MSYRGRWWSIADVGAAWASVLLTLLAVLTAMFWSPFLTWWRRPQLSFEFRNEPPFGRETRLSPASQSGAEKIPGYVIRVRVRNEGSSAARQCIIKLTELRDANGQPILEYDSMMLRWTAADRVSPVDMPYDVFEPHMDIFPGDYEHADVLAVGEGRDEFSLYPASYAPRGIKRHYPRGEYFLNIAVICENAEPVLKDYHLIWEGDYNNIVMFEAPG
jgi:hypothetical protein